MKLAVINISGGTFSGGYRKYLLKLIPLLLEKDAISQLRVYVPEKTEMDADPSVIHYFKASRFQIGYPSIKKDLDIFKPDLIFVPTARKFRYKNIPVVNMVRNMEPLLVPFGANPVSEKLINILRARVAKQATVNADYTLAVSNHVKDFLTGHWDIPPEKVGVVYHGVNPLSEMEQEPKKPAKIPKNTSFLFTGGSIRPARGLEDLIQALPVITEKKPDLRLVVAGKADPGMQFYQDMIKNLATKLGVIDRIIWCGHLAPHEMAWCFQNCEMFVMTSRAEACPNIVLEALTHGTPSVSTDTEPMPEFFQNCAIYYPSGDSSTLALEVNRMFRKSDSEIRKLNLLAKERASYFTWERCADNTIMQLKKALKSKKEIIE